MASASGWNTAVGPMKPEADVDKRGLSVGIYGGRKLGQVVPNQAMPLLPVSKMNWKNLQGDGHALLHA